MAMQRFHTEPCVRHILLGTTMIHRQRAHPNDSQSGNPERSATRHYGKAIRLLSASLSQITGKVQGETREITILTTFLLAAFEILRRNDDRAKYWMENGMKLLGRATNATSTSPTRRIEQDANSKQLAQAFELMDVNLKIKHMKNSKRNQRSIGRCGAGGLSRRKLEKRRSCIGLFHPDGWCWKFQNETKWLIAKCDGKRKVGCAMREREGGYIPILSDYFLCRFYPSFKMLKWEVGVI